MNFSQTVHWMERAGAALRRTREETAKLWTLYKSRCHDLRGLRRELGKRKAEVAQLKAENAALKSSARKAEAAAEVAIRRRTELQEEFEAYKDGIAGPLAQYGDAEDEDDEEEEENVSAAYRSRGRARYGGV